MICHLNCQGRHREHHFALSFPLLKQGQLVVMGLQGHALAGHLGAPNVGILQGESGDQATAPAVLTDPVRPVVLSLEHLYRHQPPLLIRLGNSQHARQGVLAG